MRRVHVPSERQVWGVTIKGPVAPAEASAQHAKRVLWEALERLPELDAGTEGWSVVWTSMVTSEGPLVTAYVWVDRSKEACELMGSLADRLEDARFIVRRHGRPGEMNPVFAPRVVYLRRDAIQLGVGCERLPDLRGIEIVPEEREEVELEAQHTHPPQVCPNCGRSGYAIEIIEGYPTPEAWLAVDLGEAELGGGCIIDEDAPDLVRCRHCGEAFAPRG